MIKQIKIGITGGIGSGKSTLAKILNKMGYPSYISDVEAKRLMNTNSEIKKELISLFGKEVYGYDDKIDPIYLSSIIFSQKTALQKVNSIVHPKVLDDFKQFCIKSNNNIIFLESAILFEIGWQKYFDYTICVTANKELRIKRTCLRDNKNESEIRKRIANQLDDSEKIKNADFIIYNDENSHILEQINSILGKI